MQGNFPTFNVDQYVSILGENWMLCVCVCHTFRSYVPIICHVKCQANNQRQSTGSWAPIHGFCCTGEFVALCWRLREWKISWSLHTFAQCLCSWLWKGKDKGIFRLKYVFCSLKFHIVWITCESHVTFLILGPHWTHIAFWAKSGRLQRPWWIMELILKQHTKKQMLWVSCFELEAGNGEGPNHSRTLKIYDYDIFY